MRNHCGIVAAFLLIAVAVGPWGSRLQAAPAGSVTQADGHARNMSVDGETLFLLQVNEEGTGLADRTGAFSPEVSGGAFVQDERFGKVLAFDGEDGQAISVPDGGRMNFDDGFTLETWLYLEAEEDSHNPGGLFAMKMGSFSLRLTKEGKLSNTWMSFPSVPVATTTEDQYDYFPVASEAFGGAMTIPSNRWVHLAVTYDPERKVIRTWIDGSIDRTRYMVREGEAPLQVKPSELVLFKGMKNIRVGAIRVSSIARPIGHVPPMEVYVHQLPYEDKIALHFDHLDPDMAYPVEAAVVWENPNGPSSTIARMTLDGPEDKVVKLTVPGWKNSYYTMKIKVHSHHREIYSRTVHVANARPSGSRFQIGPDKSLSIDGRKIFPIMMYHVRPEDYAMLGDMGFNILTPNSLSGRFMGFGVRDQREYDDIATSLNAAAEAGVYLTIPGRNNYPEPVAMFQDHPALGLWYGADEPWGTLDKVMESYNSVKILTPDAPILIVQNNLTRMSESAEGADIIACDPYPIPNVSLRTVAYATAATVRSVAGLKPVWTVVCQYGSKEPTLEELRCMLHLAIISGANGLGVYAWDERRGENQDAWYTKKNPEDLEILRAAIGEIAQLSDILVIPNSERLVTVTPENLALHAAIKEAEGRMYLFIANDSRRSEAGTFTIEGVSGAEGVSLLEGGGPIAIRDGRVNLELPPLGVRAFEITVNGGD